MRLYLIISFLFLSHLCFAQPNSGKMDSTSSGSTAQITPAKANDKNIRTTTHIPSAAGEKTGTLLSKLYYAGFFLGGLILTMAFQFILRKSEVRGSARGKDTIQDLSEAQRKQISDLIERNTSLFEENISLGTQIEKLKAQLLKSDLPKEDQFSSRNPVQEIESEAAVTSELDDIKNNPTPEATKESYQSVLYFSTPNRSGEFRGGSNTFDEGASIYKFSLISPTEAFFEFCDNKSSVGLALNHRNDLILAVAEESNAFNPGASRIVIDGNQQGQALLEGSFWKVTKKAKIKYI